MNKSSRKEKWIRDPVFFYVEKINMGRANRWKGYLAPTDIAF